MIIIDKNARRDYFRNRYKGFRWSRSISNRDEINARRARIVAEIRIFIDDELSNF